MSALKDLTQYIEANEATLETIQTSLDELRREQAQANNEVAGALVELQRVMGVISDKLQLVDARLVVLQDQVVDGFRQMNNRVVYVEDKAKLAAVKGGKK